MPSPAGILTIIFGLRENRAQTGVKIFDGHAKMALSQDILGKLFSRDFQNIFQNISD